jgi:hypothetical protein
MEAMDRKSLTRPPRPKRPQEVIRHVDDSLEAVRRMAAARKARPAGKDEAEATTVRPVRGADRT